MPHPTSSAEPTARSVTPAGVMEGNRGSLLAGKALVLVLAVWYVFSPALHGYWLWDDGFTIPDNALMHDAGGWWKFWFAPPGPDYFPLTSTVEWSLWRVFGGNTLPYHLTSVALHLASVFLLWKLFARLGLRLAWLGALLFAIHPLTVESVAWISELKNTVSLPLLLVSMLAWLNYDERSRFKDYLVAVAFFLAALLAKTSVVTLPCLLLLYAWWRHGKISQKTFRATVPFFGIALLMGVITICFQRQWAIGEEPLEIGGMAARTAGAGWALLFYFGKFFWPVGLLPAYPPWKFASLTLADFVPWLLMFIAVSLLWYRRTAWKQTALFGLGFFVLTLAPVLGFLSMSYMRIAWVADHFTYLPIIGLIGLVVAGVDACRSRLPQGVRRGGAVVVSAFCCILAWCSHTYAENFRGQPALWSYTLWQYPESWMAELNLGLSISELGRLPEAEVHFEKSIQLRGDFYGSHLASANILAQMNRLDEAVQEYAIAEKLKPDSLTTYINCGDVMLRLGSVRGAAQQYYLATLCPADSALARKNLAAAHFNLANVLLRQNRSAEAATHYQSALEIDPSLTAAREALDKLPKTPVLTSNQSK